MERHVQTLLNKLSVVCITIATIIFLFLILQTPQTCIPTTTHPRVRLLRFPKSSCDSSRRDYVPMSKKNERLWSTRDWKKKVNSYAQFFRSLRDQRLLSNHSKVLCVSAGAGHEVAAVSEVGARDVTGVELVESPPLVSRADPHNLPFFDGAFDLVFSAHLDEALFPARFVAEMERTVRVRGVCVVVVEECGGDEMRGILRMFKHSVFVSAKNVTLIGLRMTQIIMRNRNSS
ncbi:hypothetical protein AAG906_040066 [Vitis piasezkii]